MSKTKDKLKKNEPALGGWTMTGHPAVAEIMAGEGFDFIGVDMEHTPINVEGFYRIALAAKGTGCDVLARLPSCDAVLAKQVLDMGAAGIIVPSVNSPAEAAQSVAMAKFPPEGIRGASLCRATGFGARFNEYFQNHNRDVLVVVMLEHIKAVKQADAILATPGVDAALIGPYDLSASMGLAGQLNHPDVLAAQQAILGACLRQKVAAGIHVVPLDAAEVQRRIEQGFRFLPCGIDTAFVREGCRQMLKARET
ncbi:MAG: 2,4-dihydroxyhept-2-ene-1,7-dioic acid aldolase [Verrucomicrobia bacterium]|nr:2,4-dihydroxyhept-2-ene-1,7-dioic acid aldolase [Verrucomicrobiota bacterium]